MCHCIDILCILSESNIHVSRLNCYVKVTKETIYAHFTIFPLYIISLPFISIHYTRVYYNVVLYMSQYCEHSVLIILFMMIFRRTIHVTTIHVTYFSYSNYNRMFVTSRPNQSARKHNNIKLAVNLWLTLLFASAWIHQTHTHTISDFTTRNHLKQYFDIILRSIKHIFIYCSWHDVCIIFSHNLPFDFNSYSTNSYWNSTIDVHCGSEGSIPFPIYMHCSSKPFKH